MTTGHPHPPELIERVRELAAQTLSATRIGAEVHLSRNSVIGICFRNSIALLGKSGGQTGPRRRDAHRRKRVPAIVAAIAPVVPDDLPPPFDTSVATNPVTLFDLDMRNHCRWPVGEPRKPDFRYCGGEREFPGTDMIHCYCAGHAANAFNYE
jgi:GcrA cell cycle regulator